MPYEVRKGYEYYWCVDPLDGTKEFLKRNGGRGGRRGGGGVPQAQWWGMSILFWMKSQPKGGIHDTDDAPFKRDPQPPCTPASPLPTGEFTVNIALMSRGEPVLGIVHVPCSGKTYW